MAEMITPDGSWAFNGEVLRIVPGSGRDVHEVRKVLGEVAIPLEAIATATFEPARKGGHLRLRLRKGADPLTDAVAGALTAPADPYRLAVPKGSTGAAEYFADEVRDTLQLWQTPGGPCETYLLPGPSAPVSATAGDGTVTFDGERVRLEWTLFASSAKEKAGPQEFAIADLTGVEWTPLAGAGYGSLRFRVKGEGAAKQAQEDPHCLSWGIQKFGGTTALVAAAVLARLPKDKDQPAVEAAPQADQDVIIRRLGELGELHRSGVLTDEEFVNAKQAILRRL
ncbi:DUF4429 domain-containing protein [Nonomuraea sp. NPDC050556]|uniref:DUF4429 domain-containing protein n=1 Tax=Nonomuraea sp. NPDC050556 TaxID=3364369 RepID=UPI0037AB48C9